MRRLQCGAVPRHGGRFLAGGQVHEVQAVVHAGQRQRVAVGRQRQPRAGQAEGPAAVDRLLGRLRAELADLLGGVHIPLAHRRADGGDKQRLAVLAEQRRRHATSAVGILDLAVLLTGGRVQDREGGIEAPVSHEFAVGREGQPELAVVCLVECNGVLLRAGGRIPEAERVLHHVVGHVQLQGHGRQHLAVGRVQEHRVAAEESPVVALSAEGTDLLGLGPIVDADAAVELHHGQVHAVGGEVEGGNARDAAEVRGVVRRLDSRQLLAGGHVVQVDAAAVEVAGQRLAVLAQRHRHAAAAVEDDALAGHRRFVRLFQAEAADLLAGGVFPHAGRLVITDG